MADEPKEPRDPKALEPVLPGLIQEWYGTQSNAEQFQEPHVNILIQKQGQASDLMTADFAEEPPLVEAFLYRAGCSLIVGPPAAGKTHLALSLAKALASGETFMGLETNCPRPGERCRVGAMFLEGNLNNHRGRLNAHGDHLDLWTALSIRVPGFNSMPRNWDLTDPRKNLDVIEWVKHDRLDVLILDPLVNMKHPALDENTQVGMGTIQLALDDIRDATGVAIVLVHHTGHDGKRARGHSSLPGYVDCELLLKPGKDQTLTLSWRMDPRDCARPPSIPLKRGPDGILERTTRALSPRALENRAIIHELKSGRIPRTELGRRLAKKGIRLSRMALPRRINEMVGQGLVCQKNSGSGVPVTVWLPDARGEQKAQGSVLLPVRLKPGNGADTSGPPKVKPSDAKDYNS